MPKKEWFEQNPKVSAYLSPELNRRLKGFMAEREINKVSQALTFILEEYFTYTSKQQSGSNDERLYALEKTVETIQKKLAEMQNSKLTVDQNNSQNFASELEMRSKSIVQGKPL